MSKYSPEITERICQSLREMKGRMGACKEAGIEFQTFSRWMKEKSEFCEAVRLAEFSMKQNVRQLLIVRIIDHSKRYWQAGAFLLNTWCPDILENPESSTLTPETIKTIPAWRIIRDMARIKGLCADDEALDQALFKPDADYWLIPTDFKIPLPKIYWLTKDAIDQISPLFGLSEGIGGTSTPILPNLDSPTDCPLHQKLISIIASYLKIQNPPTYPGDYDRNRIIDTECQMIWHTQDLIMRSTVLQTMRRLNTAYGLQIHEAKSLIAIARFDLSQSLTNEADINKAVLIHRIEEYSHNIKDRDDRAYLAAQKLLAHIQGVKSDSDQDSQKLLGGMIAANSGDLQADAKENEQKRGIEHQEWRFEKK